VASPVRAEERTKGIVVNGEQRQAGVNVVLELKARTGRSGDFQPICCDTERQAAAPPRVAIGNQVAVCFQTSQDGYVTLWSIDAKGGFDLIYPNPFSHPGKTRAAAVKANTRVCIGEDEKFQLMISTPIGKSQVYLHWTRTEDEQLGTEDYPVVGRDVRPDPSYASGKMEYEIGN